MHTSPAAAPLKRASSARLFASCFLSLATAQIETRRGICKEVATVRKRMKSKRMLRNSSVMSCVYGYVGDRVGVHAFVGGRWVCMHSWAQGWAHVFVLQGWKEVVEGGRQEAR